MGPFGRCAGDCDLDSDCAGDLICFQRSGIQNATIPGCLGTAEEDVDYCIDEVMAPSEAPSTTPTTQPSLQPTPMPTDHPTTAIFANRSQDFDELIYFSPELVGPSWTSEGSEMGPFGRCAGDCDLDSDCAGDLICFQRSGIQNATIPGCLGTAEEDVDYCIEEAMAPSEAPSTTPTTQPSLHPTPMPSS